MRYNLLLYLLKVNNISYKLTKHEKFHVPLIEQVIVISSLNVGLLLIKLMR